MLTKWKSDWHIYILRNVETSVGKNSESNEDDLYFETVGTSFHYVQFGHISC